MFFFVLQLNNSLCAGVYAAHEVRKMNRGRTFQQIGKNSPNHENVYYTRHSVFCNYFTFYALQLSFGNFFARFVNFD